MVFPGAFVTFKIIIELFQDFFWRKKEKKDFYEMRNFQGYEWHLYVIINEKLKDFKNEEKFFFFYGLKKNFFVRFLSGLI